jgi:hypothetical protein
MSNANPSAIIAPPPSPTILASRLRPSQLADFARTSSSWLWHGYLGAGMLTLLTSQWKSGKTTLLSVLLARMGKGGTLAGLPVARGRAAVISEENPQLWDSRCRKLGIGDQLSLFCRPFAARPTMAQWCELIEGMLLLRRREGLDLVVIDPLAVFLPSPTENAAGSMLDSLLPLRELTAEGLSVALAHHPRKGPALAGQSARGSGALPSHMDIIIEKNFCNPADELDRRRWLRSYSRYDETHRRLIIELNAAGDDYLVHDNVQDPASMECCHVLDLVLDDATQRLTQREILEEWSEDFPRPDQSTIARVLRRRVTEGYIRQQGTGRKNDPYRYWRADREENVHPGPRATAEQLTRWAARYQEKWLQSLGLADEPQPAAASAGHHGSRGPEWFNRINNGADASLCVPCALYVSTIGVIQFNKRAHSARISAECPGIGRVPGSRSDSTVGTEARARQTLFSTCRGRASRTAAWHA